MPGQIDERNIILQTVLRISVAGLIVLAVLGTVLSLLKRNVTALIDIDANQLFEAGRELAITGLPRLDYFPASATGLDVLFWSHHFPAYVYAMLFKVVDLNIYNFNYVIVAELLMTLLSVYWLIRVAIDHFNPDFKPYILYIYGLVVLEPLYSLFFIGAKQYLRWSLIFATLALVCLIKWFNRSERRLVWAGLAGFFAAMSPISFISLGVPIMAGVVIAFLTEIMILYVENRIKLVRQEIAVFMVGMVIPVVVFGGYVSSILGGWGLFGLGRSLSFYATLTSLGSAGRYIFEMGYFMSSLVISPHAQTLLTISMMAIFLNVIHWRILTKGQRRLIRITIIFTVTWLFFALINSSHFYASRMVWLMPLYILCIGLFLSLRTYKRYTLEIFLLSSSTIVLVQLIYRFYLRDFGPIPNQGRPTSLV